MDSTALIELLSRFGLNMMAIFILVRLIYYPRHKNKDFVFTFILFNCINFLICYLLSDTKLKTGFAFGLFAIFSIIRYRTVTVPVKEMGYFFLCVALGLINAMAFGEENGFLHIDALGNMEPQGRTNLVLLVSSNAFVLLLTLLLDRFSLTHQNVKEIVYERIDLIRPESRADMIADLRARTGLPIHKVEIRSIDFLKDVAIVHAHFYSKDSELQQMADGDDD